MDKVRTLRIRNHLRELVPFPFRVELLRIRRYLDWMVEIPTIARSRPSSYKRRQYGHTLARHSSPLDRVSGSVATRLQHGKEHNVAIACRRLNGLLVEPFEVFSYHRKVGRPSRLLGFQNGLELREGELSEGVGGGCCAVSNLLYFLALMGGMKVIERHRHCLDLFPDHQRTVPFGCGATVFYNYFDLRFENPLDQSVLLLVRIENGVLIGELLSVRDPGWTTEVYQQGHRFFRENGTWYRENHIRRRFRRTDGSVLLDQEVAYNCGKVMYDLEGQAECGKQS